jgi:hypothetical protein
MLLPVIVLAYLILPKTMLLQYTQEDGRQRHVFCGTDQAVYRSGSAGQRGEWPPW